MNTEDDAANDSRSKLRNISRKQDFLTLLTFVIGATSAFAAVLRVAIQDITGPAENLAHLALGAAVLHGGLAIMIRITSERQVYSRFFLAHISGALLAGSLFGGLASIWN